MVPEIWSAADIIFCHSGPFFALLTCHEPRKSKLKKKMKKTLEGIIISQMCTINDSHMMYVS